LAKTSLMFDFNKNIVKDGPVWKIDNFYKDPYPIAQMFKTLKPDMFKASASPSWNGKRFNDMRHHLKSDQMAPIYEFLGDVCGQPVLGHDNLQNMYEIHTNVFNMKDIEWNDYENNYWWPHHDYGWTAIVYLNEIDDSGTNLYKCLDEHEPIEKQITEEHYQPWRPKEKYEVIYHCKPKFNTLYLYDGHQYIHGQNICSNLFSYHDRINQVFFFDHRTYNNKSGGKEEECYNRDLSWINSK